MIHRYYEYKKEKAKLKNRRKICSEIKHNYQGLSLYCFSSLNSTSIILLSCSKIVSGFYQVFAQQLTNYLALGQPLFPHLLTRMGIPVLSASWNCCENPWGNLKKHLLLSSAKFLLSRARMSPLSICMSPGDCLPWEPACSSFSDLDTW